MAATKVSQAMVELFTRKRGATVSFHPNRKVKNAVKNEPFRVVIQGRKNGRAAVLKSLRTGRFLSARSDIRVVPV